MSKPLLLALFALISLFLLPVPPLIAQTQSKPPASLKGRVDALQARVTTLQSQVALLSDRIDALLGTGKSDQIQNIPIGNSPIRGNAHAPITLVMFGDYQSDYTVRALHVVNRLLETYPQQLRFVYKQYPLTQRHPMANDAALAALAAERQGRFWEMHDLLAANALRLDQPVLSVLAEQVGLNLTRFETDLHSLWALERLNEDEKLAARLGVVGVPTLYLNGRLMPTWRYDYLKEQIGRLLPH